MPKTLAQLRQMIKKEVPFVDVKPYSHNIIGVVLMQINNEYGKDEANKAIDDFDLQSLGWRKP